MTVIRSRSHFDLMNIALLSLGVCVIFSAIALVVSYNYSVSIRHEISEVRSQIKNTQTANAELKDSILVLLSGEKLQALAVARGLVLEKKPRYIEISEQWSLASRF